MNGLFARARSYWGGLRRPDRMEAEMDEEMRFHLEMEAERLVRERGMTSREAYRRARIAFGSTDRYKEEGRDARGLTGISGMGLDFRLGWRMLVRYPGLTVVAVLAMAFGIAFGAGAFQLIKDIYFPPLAYRDVDAIVRLQRVSTATTSPAPLTLPDLVAWRGKLASVEALSALSSRTRDLSPGGESSTAVAEASVSASAFTLVAPPLLGRGLVADDEAPGAPPVVVLGYDLWQRRFGGDRGVLGRVVRVGGEHATVVGVMPEDFAFVLPSDGMPDLPPQDLWVPLRPAPAARGDGPAVEVFGRLAPGVSLERARAEFDAVGAAGTAEEPRPEAGGELKPTLLGFENPFRPGRGTGNSSLFALSALFLAVLMGTICANVALLVFARAATREGEMAVRSALGASRGRIVFQLFAEALVLAAVAIAVGLWAASVGHAWAAQLGEAVARSDGETARPWADGGLSTSTIAYAAALAVLGAVVAGVLPGLRVTGRNGQAGLQSLPGRGAGMRLGRVWTAVIVGQVALTVVLVPIAGTLGTYTWKLRSADPGVRTAEFLSMRLAMDGVEAPDAAGGKPARDEAARFAAAYRVLKARAAVEPGVVGVTVASALPGTSHGWAALEVEDPGAAAAPPAAVQVAGVDADFFDVLGARVVAGHAFREGDFVPDARAVVVNESFVREHLGGRNAVGRRIRSVSNGEEPGPWLEVVGVVRDMAMQINPLLPSNAGIYRPLDTGGLHSVRVAVHVAGDPLALAGRMTELAAAADPALRVEDLFPLDQVGQGALLAFDGWFRVIVLGSFLALLLTYAGIYAILSFTVSRRTREIGVRIALGAQARQIMAAILARMTGQVAAGAVLGALLGVWYLLAMGLANGSWSLSALQLGALLAGYMAVMTGVCMLACVVPTRRALRIQPREALNADG
ncbi:MAG: ABC transporter permease [Gemmatimonadetes bacterium]|nr:ABC transporter permease [Gemmatimonadota bacterium]